MRLCPALRHTVLKQGRSNDTAMQGTSCSCLQVPSVISTHVPLARASPTAKPDPVLAQGGWTDITSSRKDTKDRPGEGGLGIKIIIIYYISSIF